MGDELWWMPSVVVFGTTALVVVLTVAGLRMRRRRGIATGRIADPRGETLDSLELRAGQALVRADEAVRHADDELGFAAAQFGDDGIADFSATLGVARSQLHEAFRLRQRLSDEVPDSDATRRSWSQKILSLCEAAVTSLDEQTRSFDERRSIERSVPEHAAGLRALTDSIRQRIPDATADVDDLTERFTSEARIGIDTLLERAQTSLSTASEAIAQAEQDASDKKPAGEQLAAAEVAARAASAALDGISRAKERLNEAGRELERTIAGARIDLERAATLRDRNEIPDAAAEIASAMAELQAVIEVTAVHSGNRDPVASTDRVRDAGQRLDAALAHARNQQQRIDNAREALRGALFSAESHITAASDFIAVNRGSVGADARTRVVEAERQLALARAESDPVEALDIARRASRIAQDAEALAYYDAGPRSAPLASDD